MPIVFLEDWSAENEDDMILGAGVEFDFLFADGYAYLHKVLGRKQDLEYARRLFRDAVFYFDSGPGADPAHRAPLGYHFQDTPFGMTAKLHAYSGRWQQIYLMEEETSGAARKAK
jgi:hypothetical protein